MFKRYRIAGLTVDMDLRYQRTAKQGIPYEIPMDEREPDMSLMVDESVMEKARAKYPRLNNDDLEYMLYSFLFADGLLNHDGMMLHASAVATGGYAYLFSADSGVGKSTHTGFWLELLGDKAFILNDDKPAIRRVGGVLKAFGTPFSGKYDISRNAGFPVGGICFLHRAEKNEIHAISPGEGVMLMLPQTQYRSNKEQAGKCLTAMDTVLTGVPLYAMGCTKDISAARMAFDTMKKSVPVHLDEVIEVMTEQLTAGGQVSFTTKGNSMLPLLVSGRDGVVLEKSDVYRVGDVIFYKGPGGYILHRILAVGEDTVTTKGDGNPNLDEPIAKGAVIAKAVAFNRNGKTVTLHTWWYPVYRRLIIKKTGYRLVHFLTRCVRCVKRKTKKQ